MPLQPNHPRKKPVFKTAAIDDQQKFQPLPEPAGPYPFDLDINDVIPGLQANKLVFHIAGDTGGILFPEFQHRVVREMAKQYHEASMPEDRPQFFFHLGDVVYNYGQAAGYQEQPGEFNSPLHCGKLILTRHPVTGRGE